MTVYILGGGPAGMAVADALADKKNAPPFVLLESNASLGGLAQTLDWSGCGRHDLGPHKIYSRDQALSRRVEDLLSPTAWRTCLKTSRIYINGAFLPYPPSPLSLLNAFGAPRVLNMTTGYLAAKGLSFLPDRSKNFEEDAIARVGRGLYEALIKPVALKIWGDPAKLDTQLSRSRLQTPSVKELLCRLFKVRTANTFEVLEFKYPVGGLSKLWKAIEKKASAHGQFVTGHTVKALRVKGKRIERIICQDRANGAENVFEVKPEDFVLSTIPLRQTAGFLDDALADDVRRLISETVQLNDLLLVFLKLKRDKLLNETWVFVPDPDILFHRVSEQKAFDPSMVPSGSIVCCEIMDHAKRPMGSLTDNTLIHQCLQGLEKMGYHVLEVTDSRVIRLPKTYPVYRTGSGPALQKIRGAMDDFDNFRSIGRQGAFQYIGILDAMDIGYRAADWLMNGARPDSWEAERERSGNYPILD